MKATRIKNACYLFLCLSQYKLCVPLSIMICTLRVNYIKFLSYTCIMAFWLKSLLCAGIFFSTAFDRGCFNITKWKTNEYVLAIVRTQRLAMYCGNGPLCDCFIYPCCQIEHFQSNYILLVWIFVCTLCVLKKKKSKKIISQ